MLVNAMADIAKLSLVIVCAHALLGAYARRRRPQWNEHLTKRRVAVLAMLTLAVASTKLIEDVVGKESGPVDEATLWFIRGHVPAVMNRVFAVVTFSGSAPFLMPVAVVAATALLIGGRRFEAVPESGKGQSTRADGRRLCADERNQLSTVPGSAFRTAAFAGAHSTRPHSAMLESR